MNDKERVSVYVHLGEKDAAALMRIMEYAKVDNRTHAVRYAIRVVDEWLTKGKADDDKQISN